MVTEHQLRQVAVELGVVTVYWVAQAQHHFRWPIAAVHHHHPRRLRHNQCGDWKRYSCATRGAEHMSRGFEKQSFDLELLSNHLVSCHRLTGLPWIGLSQQAFLILAHQFIRPTRTPTVSTVRNGIIKSCLFDFINNYANYDSEIDFDFCISGHADFNEIIWSGWNPSLILFGFCPYLAPSDERTIIGSD